MITSQQVAQELLDIQAVTLSPHDPYHWASGILSPIYCDNRLVMSHPESRQLITQAFVQAIKEHYPEADVIAGTATAGIPHAAFISQAMDLPMVYVRGSAKDHGKENQIEGRIPEGSKVLMVEDLISTGGSVLEAAEAIQAAGHQVLGAVGIFSYLLPASRENFDQADLPLVTLTDYLTLLEVASADPVIAEARPLLEEWYQDPQAWGRD